MKPHLMPRVIVTTGMPERYITGLDETLVCAIVRKPVEIGTLTRLLRACCESAPFEGGGEFPHYR
jgi:hypothetical protein